MQAVAFCGPGDQAVTPAAASPLGQGQNHPRIKNGADPQIKAPFKKFIAERTRTEAVLGRFFDELDRVTEGLDVLGCVIGDLDAELFFESHDQLDSVEAVCAQVVDKRSVFNYFVFFNTKVLNNDLFNAVCDVAHTLVLTHRALLPFWVSARSHS
jgi:hypothetical protein